MSVCSTVDKKHDLSLNRCETGWILSLVQATLLSTQGALGANNLVIVGIKKKKKKKYFYI